MAGLDDRTIEPETPDARALAALRRIQRFSTIAVGDCAQVTNASPDVGPVTLNKVYARRDLQADMERVLRCGHEAEKTILVVGNAGQGKTSLLWDLHRTVAAWPGWQAWLIKAGDLAFSEANDGRLNHLSTRQIQNALDAVPAASRDSVLVLIDTIDLLPHEEADRHGLTEVLGILSANGCYCVLSCRPQEVLSLRSVQGTLK